VAGLLAAAFGLSSGMFTLIYAIFFSETDNVAGYILFTAIVVALVVIVAVAVMRPVRSPIDFRSVRVRVRACACACVRDHDESAPSFLTVDDGAGGACGAGEGASQG
jgi:hypothetical protein